MKQHRRCKTIGIIGAGFSGLLAGYYLSKHGFKVALFEKNRQIGGLLETINTEGDPIEKFYHHFFSNDKYFLRLIRDLGLSERITWNKATTGNLIAGKVDRYSSAADILKCQRISFFSKARFAILSQIFFLLPISFFRTFTAKQIIQKILGKENWEQLWGILVRKKFGYHFDEIAATWFISRIKKRKSFRTLLKGELGYIEGGFQVVLDEMRNEILKHHGEILIEQEAVRLETERSKIKINGQCFDYAISTISTTRLNKIAGQEITPTVEYDGVICALISSKTALSPYYWLNVLDETLPFVCIVEQTSMIDKSRYGNKNYVYLSRYCSKDDAEFLKKDSTLKKEWLGYLSASFPAFNPKLAEINIFKSADAQPIIPVNYIKPQYATMLPRVYSLTMANIFPEDRGLNEAVREAKKLCDIIAHNE